MKIFSGIFGFLILLTILCFALSNGQEVVVGMTPFEGVLHMPLYMVALLPLLLGLVIGALWTWFRGMGSILRTRRLSKEVNSLKNKIIHLEQSAVHAVHLSLPKKRFWNRKS